MDTSTENMQGKATNFLSMGWATKLRREGETNVDDGPNGSEDHVPGADWTGVSGQGLLRKVERITHHQQTRLQPSPSVFTAPVRDLVLFASSFST